MTGKIEKITVQIVTMASQPFTCTSKTVHWEHVQLHKDPYLPLRNDCKTRWLSIQCGTFLPSASKKVKIAEAVL